VRELFSSSTAKKKYVSTNFTLPTRPKGVHGWISPRQQRRRKKKERNKYLRPDGREIEGA
jgi:hypothetical protein